jgi:hypothetical protein
MLNNSNGDDNIMLKTFDHASNGYYSKQSKNNSDSRKNSAINNDKKINKQMKMTMNGELSESHETNVFLTLLLKNLTFQERLLLLNKLLDIDWANPDDNDSLDNFLQELINTKKTEEDLKKTLDYEYFLWDLKNWKNYFLSLEKK